MLIPLKFLKEWLHNSLYSLKDGVIKTSLDVIQILRQHSMLSYIAHINTSEMITGTGKAKYKECEYTYYFDKKGTPSEGGRKYASRLIYPNREIYIEENITYIYDDEIQNVESVLYSEDEITKENANDFIYSLHDETPSCGIQLNEFKKIEENYYYIKFDILGDC